MIEHIFGISILIVLANALEMVTGCGSSTLVVPTLLLFFAPAQVILLVGIIHWFGDIWKLLFFRRAIRPSIILSVGIPGLVAAILGATIPFAVTKETIEFTVGLFLLSYTGFLLLNPTFKIPQTKTSAFIGGSASGFMAGAFGMEGGIRSAFLTMFDLHKEVFVASEGGIALLIDSIRVPIYLLLGARLSSDLSWGLMLFVPLSFVGAWIGQHAVGAIPQRFFRLVIALVLFILGAKLVFFP